MTIIITFILYSLIILSIAVFAYRRTEHHADYILGSRRFGPTVTAMGVAASDMSAWLMLSVPSLFYLYGLNQMWIPISLLIGSFLNWHMVGPRLRIYTKVAKDSLTLPSYFQNRFLRPKMSAIRLLSAIIFLIFFTYYAASGFVGIAKLFITTFHFDYHTALLISAPVVIVYTAIGGYLAVNWIDLFQGFLMLFALVFLAIVASVQFDPSLLSTPAIASVDIARFNPFYDLTIISFLSAIAWGLGYFGQPHILVRFMSSRSTKDVRIGKYICLAWMFAALFAASFIGFIGFYYFPLGSLISAELIFPELAQKLFPGWFTAVVFAAIISAIMSTVAAVLIGASASLIEDGYRPFLRPKAKQSELVWAGRIMVFIVSICAVFIALQGEHPSVFLLVSYAWAGLGSAFGPVVILSIYWARMSYMGAVMGMMMGATTCIL